MHLSITANFVSLNALLVSEIDCHRSYDTIEEELRAPFFILPAMLGDGIARIYMNSLICCSLVFVLACEL